ncbi:MAG: FlgB family protein [Pseudomonadota bacterium]
MFKSLDVFKMSHAMAVHAGTRQAAISQNVANADTPGYRAQDVTPFAQFYNADDTPGSGRLKATRAGHIDALGGQLGGQERRPEQIPDPNDNAVSLELEMVKAVEVKRQHDRAVAVYKSHLGLLRTALGRG